VITVASGAAMAQVITFLLSPIITRLYGPESFGLLGTFNSFLAILSTSVALTYPLAIVLPKKDKEAKTLVQISLFTSFLMSFAIVILMIFLGKDIVEVLNVEVLLPYIYLIPIVLIFSAGRQVAEQWLIRKREFKTTAKIAILQSIIINISKVSCGIINPIGSTLIFIASIGQGIHMGILMWGSKKTYLDKEEKVSTILSSLSFVSLMKIGKKYSDFPIYRAPQVLVASITQSMPILLLTAFFGPISAGFYTLGMTVLSLPSQLIGKSVGDVFYPRIAEAVQNKEELSSILIKATFLLAFVGFIPFGVVIFFGPSLFSLIFGGEWERAGVYASWIALWSYALFISNPSIKTLSVISAQKFYLFFTIFNILFRGSALLIGGLINKDDFLAVAYYSISGAFLSIVLTVVTISKSKRYSIL
jgi:O-antigen/teichoic acid export membrane protein